MLPRALSACSPSQPTGERSGCGERQSSRCCAAVEDGAEEAAEDASIRVGSERQMHLVEMDEQAEQVGVEWAKYQLENRAEHQRRLGGCRISAIAAATTAAGRLHEDAIASAADRQTALLGQPRKFRGLGCQLSGAREPAQQFAEQAAGVISLQRQEDA